MDRLIKNLAGQLKKVINEHPSDINRDTYWKGVRIGLETALNLVIDLKRVSENSSHESAALPLHDVSNNEVAVCLTASKDDFANSNGIKYLCRCGTEIVFKQTDC